MPLSVGGMFNFSSKGNWVRNLLCLYPTFQPAFLSFSDDLQKLIFITIYGFTVGYSQQRYASPSANLLFCRHNLDDYFLNYRFFLCKAQVFSTFYHYKCQIKHSNVINGDYYKNEVLLWQSNTLLNDHQNSI